MSRWRGDRPRTRRAACVGDDDHLTRSLAGFHILVGLGNLGEAEHAIDVGVITAAFDPVHDALQGCLPGLACQVIAVKCGQLGGGRDHRDRLELLYHPAAAEHPGDAHSTADLH